MIEAGMFAAFILAGLAFLYARASRDAQYDSAAGVDRQLTTIKERILDLERFEEQAPDVSDEALARPCPCCSHRMGYHCDSGCRHSDEGRGSFCTCQVRLFQTNPLE